MDRRRPLVGVTVNATMGFGRDVLRGVMRYANARRKWLLHEELRAVGNTLDNWPKCDGAVLAVSMKPIVEQVCAGTRHVISCSGNADPAAMPVVCIDDAAIGRMAATHLLNCRIENFGFYGRSSHTVSNNRAKGFRDALAAEGYSCSESLIEGSFAYGWTARPHWPKLIDWLQSLPKPVGIMAMDDMAARDVAAACFSFGIPVPERVVVLGVNDDDLLCGTAWPPLSSVAVDFTRVGEMAARLLDKMMAGETLTPEQRQVRLQPIGVVRRASTDILAVDDPNLAEALRYIREHACDPCSVTDVLAFRDSLGVTPAAYRRSPTPV